MTVLVVSPAAYSKGKKKKAAVEPTATLTPTATPTPEVHMWNFDSDKAGEVPAGWKAVEGDWQVIPDPSAPSKPIPRLACRPSAQVADECARVLPNGNRDGPD